MALPITKNPPTTISRGDVMRRLRESGNPVWRSFVLPRREHLRPDEKLRLFSFAPVQETLLPIPLSVDELRIEAIEGDRIIFADPWQDGITPRPSPLSIVEILTDTVRLTPEGEFTLYLVRLERPRH